MRGGVGADGVRERRTGVVKGRADEAVPDWREENAGAREPTLQRLGHGLPQSVERGNTETRTPCAVVPRDPGANPFHYVVVHVDGKADSLEVISVDWGCGFNP